MLEGRLKSQKETTERLVSEKDDVKKVGDAIYLNFEKAERLLSIVRQMKKGGASDDEIQAALSSHKARLKGAEIEVEL